MPIPVTFSAPGEAFATAAEDQLRYALWLAHLADNLMVGRYAYDPDNLSAGVRIVQKWTNASTNAGMLSLDQCIVSHFFTDSVWTYATSKQGTKRVLIGVEHLFPHTSAYASDDVDSMEETANAVCQRTEGIIMRGTLYQVDQDSNRGMLINPSSPLFTAEDAPSPELIGAYDPGTVRYINDGPPLRIFRRTEKIPTRPLTKKEREMDLTDVERDHPELIGVSYGVFAEYEVRITDFEQMTSGGILG